MVGKFIKVNSLSMFGVGKMCKQDCANFCIGRSFDMNFFRIKRSDVMEFKQLCRHLILQ